MKKFPNKIRNEKGFSLLEATVSIVIMKVVLLSVFSVFTYSVVYNTGNNLRSQSLSVLQREIELVRSYKFTPTVIDSDLTGGTKASKYVNSADGTSFKVDITIDDDPFTNGIQIDSSKTLKEVTISITPAKKVDNWKTSVASEVVVRRVRGN